MKSNNLFFKFLFGFLVLTIIFGFSGNMVMAKTNGQYTSTGITVDTSESGSIGSAILGFIQDLILGLLGKAIVGLAWCIEILIRGVCALLTFDWSNAIFPWADRVIFNGMALLDVNFINPEPGSLFMNLDGTYSLIGNSIRNIYFTGLSIALGFLGIIVAIMAIRLAISSIASEKAKYKEAVVHWLTALILLFGMHYVISFVFYLNEQLVEVASTIVIKQTSGPQGILDTFKASIGLGSYDAQPFELLADYFRTQAVTKWNTESFTSAILYAIFVVQSIMFFYAYVKRFFYVTILAVIAPFVIVYDFLQKSVS